MSKLKAIIFVETIIILFLIFIILFLVKSPLFPKNHNEYCGSNPQDSNNCLLSPRIYNEILKPNSFLILNFNPLRDDIENYIDKNNLDVSVYIENLRTGASFGINSSNSYPAVSLNKLPIAVIVLKKVERGEYTLDTKIKIRDYDRNSDFGNLYFNPVKELSVRELLHHMLAESDNTAAGALQTDMTQEDLIDLTDYVNYYSNNISAEHIPITSTYLTPKTISNMFASLYLSTMLEPENSELILRELTNTSFDIKKYANLPSDVVVSQKFGEEYIKDKVYHSCGIIYVSDSRFFYCIMTKDIDSKKAPEVIGTILNKLYNFIVEKKKVDDFGI